MITLLLVIIYIAFISLGLPDSLLGTAWPAAYGELGVAVSMAGFLSAVISCGTIISSLLSSRIIRVGSGRGDYSCAAMTAAALFGISPSSTFWVRSCLPYLWGLARQRGCSTNNLWQSLQGKTYELAAFLLGSWLARDLSSCPFSSPEAAGVGLFSTGWIQTVLWLS